METTGTAPKARSGHAAVLYKDSMYVFGGYDGSARLNDLYTLNLSTKEWKEIKPSGEIPTPRMNLCCEVLGDHFYIFAGHSGSTSSNDFFKFHFGKSCIFVTQWF